MISLFRRVIRPLAFLRAEIFEVLRQPRLILILVLGPFLILLLFGIGYRNIARSLRTIFVAPQGSPLSKEIEQFKDLGPQLIFMGVTPDEASARQRLARGEVDVVAVAPSNAAELIQQNKQAVFTLYHNEIDPIQVDYVRYFGEIYVAEVNRRILRGLAEKTKTDSASIQANLKAARTSAQAIHQALDKGDKVGAQQQQALLDRNLSALELAVGASVGLLGGVQQTLGSGNNSADSIGGSLADARQLTDALGKVNESSNVAADSQKAAQLENDLGTLETKLADFQRVDPNVLVSPFAVQTKGIAVLQPRIADFFAPSVLVLLLQHLAITFAALSIVREKRLGTIELFRVSPISPGETLIGKYLSYLIFGGAIAAVLTALVVFALAVPMLGNWINYALTIAALVFASLGIGFVISLISETDTQAVQYSMIVLLATVFFSGFFLRLEALWEPVRAISYALPATYAINLLQDIMLRGAAPNLSFLLTLAGIGVVGYVLSLLLLRRTMRKS